MSFFFLSFLFASQATDGDTEKNNVGRTLSSEESGIVLRGVTSEPIAPDMLLLRGCVLRNTRWAVGLVLNTGPDTKIMMSMSKVRGYSEIVVWGRGRRGVSGINDIGVRDERRWGRVCS